MAAPRTDSSSNPTAPPLGKAASDVLPPSQPRSSTVFFSGASNFEISGGNFSSVGGDMHTTHNYDYSHKSNFNNEYATHNNNSHNTTSEYNDTYTDTRRMNIAAWTANQRTANMYHGQDNGYGPPRPYNDEQLRPGLYHQQTESTYAQRGRRRWPTRHGVPEPPASAPPLPIESREQFNARNPPGFDAVYGGNSEPMYAPSTRSSFDDQHTSPRYGYSPSTRSSFDDQHTSSRYGYSPSTRSSFGDQYMSSQYPSSTPVSEDHYSGQAACTGGPHHPHSPSARDQATSAYKSKNPFAAFVNSETPPSGHEPLNGSESEVDGENHSNSVRDPGHPSPWQNESGV